MTSHWSRRIRFSCGPLILALSVVPAYSQESDAPRRVPIEGIEFYPETADEKTGHPVTLEFDGVEYEGDWRFESLGEKPSELESDETFMIGVIERNKRGSPQEILELWHDDEKAEIEFMIADEEMFHRNRDFYSRIRSSSFLAKVRYGRFTIFFIRHHGPDLGEMVKIYPLLNAGEAFRLSNRLSSDPVYQYFTTAYRKKLETRDSGGE